MENSRYCILCSDPKAFHNMVSHWGLVLAVNVKLKDAIWFMLVLKQTTAGSVFERNISLVNKSFLETDVKLMQLILLLIDIRVSLRCLETQTSAEPRFANLTQIIIPLSNGSRLTTNLEFILQ